MIEPTPAPTPATPAPLATAPPRGRGPRIALRSLVATVIGLALVATGLVIWSVRRAFPTHRGELALPGLSAPVTVYRDAYGIPHIYAQTEGDLYRAQGYVHAQDRFWQMDLRRHLAAGRLAELFGADLVGTDALVRTLGFRRVAEQEWQLLSQPARSYLTAYADGVNAWIAANEAGAGKLGLAYTMLKLTNASYRVEPWDPVDSLAWLKVWAWELRSNMQDEATRGLLLAHGLTRDQVEQLYPPYPYERNEPVLATGAVRSGEFDPAATGTVDGEPGSLEATWLAQAAGIQTLLSRLAALLADWPGGLGGASPGIGSNAWVVAGAFTSTGKPLLANDPHLAAAIPGAWYQNGLHCACASAGPFNVAGFSFAGFPGVVIGHNDRIAWGLTNLYADASDLYLERVDGDSYLNGGRWVAMTTRTERIDVAGCPPVTIKVRETRHGPLLSDRDPQLHAISVRPPLTEDGWPRPRVPATPLVADAEPSLDPAASGTPDRAIASPYAISLRWTALEPGRTAEAIFAINRAADWESLRAGAALFDAPAQNLVYADAAGNIGYQAVGRIPVRVQGHGTWPAPGWNGSGDWTGYVPFPQLPSILNPDRGYLVSANQAVIGKQYQRLLTGSWPVYGYRSQRINELLVGELSTGKVSAEFFRQMQFDHRNNFAPVLVPYLLQVGLDSASPVRAARDLLADWDYQQPAQEPAAASAAAAFYNAVWRHLQSRLFDELPDGLASGDGDRWFEVVRGLLLDPGSPWWDAVATPDRAERRDEILAAAMSDAYAELTDRLGGDPSRWRWGQLHQLVVDPGPASIAPARWLFNRSPQAAAGSGDAVNATGAQAGGYQTGMAASMRMIVDLSDLDESRWVQLTGNSGHPFHENYDDQLPLWLAGTNLPMRWDRESIEGEASHTLTLAPEPR